MRTDPGQLLPPHLAERTIRLSDAPLQVDRSFVLCWLHHAVRDHENPALDVALTVGNALDRPVLVYQGLGGRHRFNADRHHVFIMEGARDLHAGLAARGIAGAFWLPIDPESPSPLGELLVDACAFVAEDFPAPPFPRWTRRWAGRASCATFAVDAACVMPMRQLARRFTRAYALRDAARPEWTARLRSVWPEVTPATPPLDTSDGRLGFAPVDLAAADLLELSAACRIDHSVPPVSRTLGGSRAGYDRWARFRDEHLAQYARRRNDATAPDAVSGLSPYLHHGHVSPFRIAREAAAVSGSGAEKFLDELLVWRELAFNFCANTAAETLETLDALPDWARATLHEHRTDRREATLTWDRLARAKSGDRLWDAAQRSLLWNGELHNNVRMTWGKMIPRWTATPEAALETLIDLNHRFALDGNDPCSYGGLLWCLGQFDRPFEPAQPILGTIRPRSTREHGRRLDPVRYEAAVEARAAWRPCRVGVVGAGIAGLACARLLADHGCDVVVFDRGRRVGGRTAVRQVAHDAGPLSFDHGAPCFTVTDPRFDRVVRAWQQEGVCARWSPRRAVRKDGVLHFVEAEAAETLFVGVPGMSALAEHLASGLVVRGSVLVTALDRDAAGWTLRIDDAEAGSEAGPFDAIVLAMPAPQARRLLDVEHAGLNRALASMRYHPAWVGFVAVADAESDLPELIDDHDDPVIARLICEDGKPGRSRAEGLVPWVVHAKPDWSADRYDAPQDEIASALSARLAAVLAAASGAAPKIVSASAHRWGFAGPAAPGAEGCRFDAATALAVCGDGFGEGDVQSALLSGQAAAARILGWRASRAEPAAAPGTLWSPV